MSSAQIVQDFDSRAGRLLRLLESIESADRGVSRPQAMQSIARRIGVAPGTLENIKRERTKGVRAWVLGKLHEALVAEIGRIQGELAAAASCGVAVAAREVGAAAAVLTEAKSILAEEDKLNAEASI